MQSSQEGSSERSRSQRGLEVGAAQTVANPVTPSQSMTTSSSTSQSTPEPRGSRDQRIAIPENRIAVHTMGEAGGTLDIQGNPYKSPETLSQFLGSPQSSPLIAPNMNAVQLEAQDHVHSNPFHGQYESTRSGQQGAASSQGQSQGPTFIKNELNVSMDPFVVAQAAHAVEEARSSLKSQAIQAVEESQRFFRYKQLRWLKISRLPLGQKLCSTWNIFSLRPKGQFRNPKLSPSTSERIGGYQGGYNPDCPRCFKRD